MARKHISMTAGAACLGLMLAACGSSSSNAASSTPSSTAGKHKISIGIVVGITSDPYFVTMKQGAEAEAKKLGVTLYWAGSSTTYSPATEIPYVQAVLAKHPSAFVLAATDAHALVPPMKQAVADHIPVLTVDSTIADTSILDSRISGNNLAGGKLAAKLLVNAIGGNGQVLLMEGVPGVTPDELRAQGFQQALKRDPKVDFVGTQFSHDVPTNAQNIVQQELSRYPNLKGIFAIDDTTAEGVVAELKALGKLGKVKVVAYDAEPTEVAALKADKLVGLIAQQPAYEGMMAVKYAVEAAEGKGASLPKVVQVPNITITYSNYKSNEKYFYKAG